MRHPVDIICNSGHSGDRLRTPVRPTGCSRRWQRICLEWLFGFAVLFGANAWAQTEPAVAEALVKQCGLWDQLVSLPEMAQAQLLQSFQRQQSRATPAELQRMQQVAERAFAIERLRARVVQVFSERLQPEYLSPIQAWYSSPLGARILQAESQVPDDKQATNGLALLEVATPARKALIVDILKSTHAAEWMEPMLVGMALAVGRGLNASNPGTAMPTEGELRAAMKEGLPQMMQFLTIMLAGSSAVEYKDVSDEDLRQYVNYLNSNAGQHLNALGLMAMGVAMNDAFEEFGHRVSSTKESANP